MKYFRKRTDEEIRNSIYENDYTGGYKFFPWLLHMRKTALFIVFLFLFFTYKIFQEAEGVEMIYGCVAILFTILSMFFIVRNYKNLKNGKSS